MKNFSMTLMASVLFSTALMANAPELVKVENMDLDPSDCTLAYSNEPGTKVELEIPAPGTAIDMDLGGSRNIAVTCNTIDDGNKVASRCNVPKTGPFSKMTMKAAADQWSKYVECKGSAG